jgi:hypothetical protein
MVAVILHVILDQTFAFLDSVGLTDGPGNFSCLLVLKLNDKLPPGSERNLSHAHRLYTNSLETTTYCVAQVSSGRFSDYVWPMLLRVNELLRLNRDPSIIRDL